MYGDGRAGSGPSYGVYGRTLSTTGFGTYGVAASATGSTYGVYGRSYSNEGSGVYGHAGATSGSTYGVVGHTQSTVGKGVWGYAETTSGLNYGVIGQTESSAGTGVYGVASSTVGGASASFGVWGETATRNGQGVHGVSTSTLSSSSFSGGAGVYGESAGGRGVVGVSLRQDSVGVEGRVDCTSGSACGHGVVGAVTGNSNGAGIYGSTILATNANARAGRFDGSVLITSGGSPGNLSVTGSIAKGGGGFKIDHPLSPEEKYLNHSFVESPDRKNLYDGVVTTDENGLAAIQLPTWFEALNRDFRYQLTVLDEGNSTIFVQAKVVEKIGNGRFTIRTSMPGVEVSWQVTGSRKDAWAVANPMPVEEDKSAEERGTYRNPEAFGMPRERGVDFKQQQPLDLDLERVERPQRPKPRGPGSN